MRILSFLSFGLLLLWPVQSADAQSAPLSDKDKAVVYFDIRLDRLLSSNLAESFGLKEQMAQNMQGDVDVSKASRVSGVMSAPESIDQLQNMEGVEELPFHFLVHIAFVDEDALNQAISKIASDSTEFTAEGKTYYRPTGNDAPKNICAGILNRTTMVMGTDSYVFMADHKAAHSNGLKSAINSMGSGEDGFRVAIDLAGAKELIDQAVEMGKQQADPMSQAFLELVPGMKDLRITLDFSGGNLFSLGSTCVDEEAATQLKEALDSIFGVAKMAGGAQLNQMKQQTPDMAGVIAVGEKILRSLSPKQNGDSVTVNVPKPDGFEDAVQKAAGMLVPMMMGGGGQGFDDFDDDF
jgi:hypothetical protein